MSFPLPIPGAMPRPVAAASRPALARRVKWGWLEWFAIAQTFFPAMLFVPGVSPVRPAIRIASFLISLIALLGVFVSGRGQSGTDSFSASTWLKITTCWLVLLLFHPNGNSPMSAFAQVLLYVAVFSPAFWVVGATQSSKQLGRLITILLICNGLSVLVGLGQVFRPLTFNPPFIPGVTDAKEDFGEGSTGLLTYTDETGRKITRPCGLSDMAGSAAVCGATAAIFALAYALRPIGRFKRLACLGLAFCSVAVMYYSQVRQMMVMLIICLIVLMAIFAAQKRFAYATTIGSLGALMVFGALSWVIATSGMVVVERFLNLANENIAEKYAESRGGYVQNALFVVLPENPVGIGLGWWGTVFGIFGDKTKPNPYWIEVMIPAWVYDGGLPLLILYVGALGFAMLHVLKIALRSKDPEVSFWAAVVFASNLGLLATCFSYVTFLATIGLQFWLLAAAVHAADLRSREEKVAALRAQLAATSTAAPQPSRPLPPMPPSGYPSAAPPSYSAAPPPGYTSGPPPGYPPAPPS